jgi:hypothetical protein
VSLSELRVSRALVESNIHCEAIVLCADMSTRLREACVALILCEQMASVCDVGDRRGSVVVVARARDCTCLVQAGWARSRSRS